MSDERNIPDEQWRRIFDEAAETPPPRVWDAIERRLDESDGPKVLPLWGTGPALSRPMVWGMRAAAAVALLLVGWWVMRPSGVDRPLVAQRQQVGQHQPKSQTPKISQPQPAPVGVLGESGAPAGQELAKIGEASSNKHAGSSRPYRLDDPANPVASTSPPSTVRQSADGGSDRFVDPKPANQPNDDPNALLPPTSAIAAGNNPAAARFAESSVPGEATEKRALLAYELLESRPLQLRGLRAIQRIVWFRSAEPDALTSETQTSKRTEREMWASVSVMPGAFNPSVSVAVPTYAGITSMNNGAPAGQSVLTSRANFSVAYQAGAGVQLSERWSIESGVGYLAGRSTVESPGQSNAFSQNIASAGNKAVTSSYYTDLLRNQSGPAQPNKAYGMANDFLASNNSRYTSLSSYDLRTRQEVTNDYQYVQVPVQVGYQLRPRKRLSLALLGGLLTNIFVRNTVDGAVVISAGDGVYRPVSWAATMGARFRYRPSRRWSASLAGVYQPSLGLGTQTDSPVQSRPTSSGMTFGVDYHF